MELYVTSQTESIKPPLASLLSPQINSLVNAVNTGHLWEIPGCVHSLLELTRQCKAANDFISINTIYQQCVSLHKNCNDPRIDEALGNLTIKTGILSIENRLNHRNHNDPRRCFDETWESISSLLEINGKFLKIDNTNFARTICDGFLYLQTQFNKEQDYDVACLIKAAVNHFGGVLSSPTTIKKQEQTRKNEAVAPLPNLAHKEAMKLQIETEFSELQYTLFTSRFLPEAINIIETIRDLCTDCVDENYRGLVTFICETLKSICDKPGMKTESDKNKIISCINLALESIKNYLEKPNSPSEQATSHNQFQSNVVQRRMISRSKKPNSSVMQTKQTISTPQHGFAATTNTPFATKSVAPPTALVDQMNEDPATWNSPVAFGHSVNNNWPSHHVPTPQFQNIANQQISFSNHNPQNTLPDLGKMKNTITEVFAAADGYRKEGNEVKAIEEYKKLVNYAEILTARNENDLANQILHALEERGMRRTKQ